MEGKRVNKLYELSLTVIPLAIASPVSAITSSSASPVTLVIHPRDRLKQ